MGLDWTESAFGPGPERDRCPRRANQKFGSLQTDIIYIFRPRTDQVNNLRAITQIVDNFRRNSFPFVKPEFTSTKFLVHLLAPEFGIYILAHPVYKKQIIQEPKKVAL
jgi:hypothetical protein